MWVDTSSRTQRHLLRLLAKEVGDRPVALLDAGCGDGGLLAAIGRTLPQISLAGFDSPEYGLQAGSSIGSRSGAHADVRPTEPDGSWPFESSSQDIVVSNQVLEHVVDLEQFCSECARVLRPGGIGVHVFPTRHVIPELHMGLPMVHRVRDHDLRVWLISLLSRIGLGVFRTESVPISVPLDEFAVAHADYCRTFTTYRTWAELVKVFHGSGFRISYRYTSMLLQDALLGRSRRLHPALEAALFPVTRALSSVTLVTSTAQEYRFDWKDIT